MKSILFYISRYPGYGGIEKVTTILANYWSKELGWKIQILSVKSQEKSPLPLLDKNVKVVFLPKPNEIKSDENIGLVKKMISKEKVDWIIYQDSYVPTQGLLHEIKGMCNLAICEHNMPDCISVQDYFTWKTKKIGSFMDFVHKFTYFRHRILINKWERERRRELYSICDKYILLSEKYINVFKHITKLDNYDKLAWINNPATGEAMNTQKKVFKKNMIFIGRLDSQKGVMLLLSIWKEIEKKHPDWTLTIVGDGPLKKNMEKYIKIHNLSRVMMKGYQPNINKYLDESSILLMTSIFEGWPLVLFEAMGRGTVPVAFDSFKTASEIIDNNKDEKLIPPLMENYTLVNLKS